jgi:hypothetical protein
MNSTQEVETKTDEPDGGDQAQGEKTGGGIMGMAKRFGRLIRSVKDGSTRIFSFANKGIADSVNKLREHITILMSNKLPVSDQEEAEKDADAEETGKEKVKEVKETRKKETKSKKDKVAKSKTEKDKDKDEHVDVKDDKNSGQDKDAKDDEKPEQDKDVKDDKKTED